MKLYRSECDDAMHVHRQLRLIILLLSFQEKVLTQENCFLFCKKYGLFNDFIFFYQSRKDLLS